MILTPVVKITGLGLATPLGSTLQDTWTGLLASRYITDHSRVPNLSDDCTDLRVNCLARRVAREALNGSCWSQSQTRAAALVVGTSKGPVERWILPKSPTSDNTNPAGRVRFFGMADVASAVADDLKMAGGPRLTLSAACASGLHAIIRAALLIQFGEAQRVLVLAAESSLHPLFVQSFRRLGVLPPEGVGCRPFDQHRAGFLMSEAAAAICMEAADPDHLEPGTILIDRFALAGDAHHLTASDPQGRTLTRLLVNVMGNRPVDLVHAHGTGTQSNDPTELAAIEAAIEKIDPPPQLYSHKGALGHSLGAAGMVSVVINCLAHRNGIIPPNVRSEHPLKLNRLRLDRSASRRSVRRSIALAAGFGGPVAVVSLASP